MSDLVWVALIAAVPPTLAVIEAARRATKRAVVLEEKVDVVHAIANDRLTKALDKIETLTTAVEKLRGEKAALGG